MRRNLRELEREFDVTLAARGLTPDIATPQYSHLTGNTKHFALGGIVTSPRMGLVGESGPEAIIPLNAGGNFGMGGGAPVSVNVNVQGIVSGSGTDIAKQIQTWLVNAFKTGAISKSEFARAIST